VGGFGLKLAIDTSLMRSLSLDEALEKVSGLGYRYVEVGLAHYSPDEASDEETRDLVRVLANHGIKLAALFGTYPVSYPEEEIRQRGVQQFQTAIGRARKLGCNLVVAELMGDGERRSECSEAFKKSMSELVPALEQNETTLCFEAHPGDFIERNKFAVDLIRSLQTSRVRYLYCVPHSFILGEDVREMIEYSKGVLGYVHLADSFRPEKTFFSGRYFPQVQPHQHLTIGRGDIDFRSVFASLQRIGYDGFLTVDPFSMTDSPKDAARESKAVAEKIMSEVGAL
jgi:myo-inositol catabolism protein IolH